MAERRWTAQQLSAIETRDKTLLVSAAAGSGKTATLTERIIRSLLDKEHPVTIDSMLIVTFTNAAAGELKEKIRTALEEAVKKNPSDEGLVRQLMMLPSASIKTIDSFCNDLLKNNAASVGLNPRYRISTGSECNILSASIMEGLIDSVYSGKEPDIATPEEFDMLAECLTETRHTEELSEVLRWVYDKCQSSLSGTALISELTEIYNPDRFTVVESTPHGAYIVNRLRTAAESGISAIEYFRREMTAEGADVKFIETADSDIEQLRLLEKITYAEAKEGIDSFHFKSFPGAKGGRTPAVSDYKNARVDIRDEMKIFKNQFLYSADEWRELYASLYEILTVLCKFLFAFDRIFVNEKRQRGIVSYADIERYTYECLWKNGERTEIARSIASGISQIYIDEYQDVNALQDKIFEAVSRPDNRFMVGDIKQSIYGFRSARPEIFASMKAAFPPLSEADGSTASIFMSSNFRCDKAIVDFTNEVFDKMFGLIGENIGYAEGDRLGYAKLQEHEPQYRKPDVVIIENHKYSDVTCISTCEAVAEKIQDLLEHGRLNNGERIKPSDIAIILRKATKLDQYVAALESRSIKAEIAANDKFFLTPEVLLTLSFLHAIDNPKRDIYLAALMCSPLFGFDASELTGFRNVGECDTLYDSLLLAAKAQGESKLCRFLTVLEGYRRAAEGLPVDKLIYKIYRETGLLALATRQGGRKNLVFLYDHARSFESGSFKGLYNFLSYIDDVINGDVKGEFDEKRSGGSADAVKITTAHSSKGLEYPIVFFAEADTPFHKRANSKDKDRWIKISEEMGISIKLRTPSGLARVNNPVTFAVNEYIKDKEFEEELRVLYVILTRAKERLFVVGESAKADIEEYKSNMRLSSEIMTPYSARKLASSLDVILASVGGGIEVDDFLSYDRSCDLTKSDGTEKAANVESNGKAAEKPSENDGYEKIEGLADIFTERFTFKYPDEYMTVLPEKLSVSTLSPTVFDTADDNVTLLFDGQTGAADNTEMKAESDTSADSIDKMSRMKNDLGTAGKEKSENPTDNSDSIINKSTDGERRDGDSEITDSANIKGTDAKDGFAAYAPTYELSDRKVTLPKFMQGSRAEESAKRGIATHYFMQFCNLERFAKEGSEAELRRLVEQGFISEADGERVRINELEAFGKSRLFRNILGASEIYRELRFNLFLPAAYFTGNEEKKRFYSDKKVLVQGVIDCIYRDSEGRLHLVDYKTDRLTKEERKNRSLAEKRMREAHSLQLSYYALAIKEMFGCEPAQISVYSLHLGDEIEIFNVLDKNDQNRQ